MTSASDEKWLPFNYFFSPDGSPTGPDSENRVGDQDTGSPGRPVSSGLQVPGEWGIVVQEQDPLGDLLAAFLLQIALHFHQQR